MENDERCRECFSFLLEQMKNVVLLHAREQRSWIYDRLIRKRATRFEEGRVMIIRNLVFKTRIRASSFSRSVVAPY